MSTVMPQARPGIATPAVRRRPRPIDREDLTARLARVVPAAEIALALPLLERIAASKAGRDAVIVAHNYQIPLISAGAADFVGDSLAMARFAATCDAPVIVVCGVHFMAETVKLLCPGKIVLSPNPLAGCSLAASIEAADVRELRARHPGAPVIAYVNTTAAVKAESDICCTSANAAAVAVSLRVPRVIMLPDRHLAGYVARRTGLDVVSFAGECEVHVKYTGADVDAYRDEVGAVVLAHPECPGDVQDRADFVGSTGAMAEYLGQHRPRRVLLLTECSMADNVAVLHPEIEFLKPCNLCSHMKSITLEGVARVLEALDNRVEIDQQTAERARRPIERMLAL